MVGRVQFGGADLVEGWGRDEEDFGTVGGDVGMCDDARQILGVFVERDALGVDFLGESRVVGAEEDELSNVIGRLDGWDWKVGQRGRDGWLCQGLSEVDVLYT